MLKSRATWKIREILFRTNLNLLRVPKCYVLLTLRDQNASECKFQKQTIFFWMSGVSFRMFRGFYEKRIFPIRKPCSQFPPTELVRNLIQIWDWSDEQNTIILQGLKRKRVRKTQKIIVVTTKQWILVGVSHYELKSRARVVCITICHECSTHMFC